VCIFFAGQEEFDFSIGKINRDAVKFAQHIHTKQERRLAGETETFERMGVGKSFE
jgi:hypothetical protein